MLEIYHISIQVIYFFRYLEVIIKPVITDETF